jgi:hypothetical protein
MVESAKKAPADRLPNLPPARRVNERRARGAARGHPTRDCRR